MPRHTAAFAVAALTVLAAPGGFAQEQEAPSRTAEEMIEVAREIYRPAGLLRRCPPPRPGEIVVCAPDAGEFRVASPTDAAIAAGEAVGDGIPRAPDLFGIPAGGDSGARLLHPAMPTADAAADRPRGDSRAADSRRGTERFSRRRRA